MLFASSGSRLVLFRPGLLANSGLRKASLGKPRSGDCRLSFAELLFIGSGSKLLVFRTGLPSIDFGINVVCVPVSKLGWPGDLGERGMLPATATAVVPLACVSSVGRTYSKVEATEFA